MNSIIKIFSEMHPDAGQLGICRLGQHSFLLKLGEILIAADPFLSPLPGRLVPSPLRPDELSGVDIILGSHDHIDHIDRETLAGIAKASPSSLLVVPESVRPALDCFPSARLIGLDDSAELSLCGLTITGIASAHEELVRDADGHYPNLGYIIQGNGVTIYHSGDCCPYDGLSEKLAPFNCDVLLLPINGRDAERFSRGILGNMNCGEAAELAGKLRCPLTIPGHYDMFAGNTENPFLFTDCMKARYPELGTMVLEPGEVRLLTLCR